MILGFAHNPASQIVSTTRSNDAYSFTGQANGSVADAVNGLNQVTAHGGASVSHDGRGNTSAIGAASYGYSAENRLTSGPGGVTLGYDPLGRLYEVSAAGSTRHFAYDGDRLLGELDGAGAVRALYAHGPGAEEPLLWFDPAGGSYGSYHADERGSIIAATDGLGNLVGSHNRYDEYGVPQGAPSTRFGYAGQPWLAELGLSYNRTRIYNPALGRFMQTDPVGYGSGINLYAYVMNDPVNLADPSGLTWRTWCVEEVGQPRQFCRTTWFEDNLDLVPGPFSGTQWRDLVHSAGNFLDRFAENHLHPPEPRRSNETPEQCRSRIAGPNSAIAGGAALGAGAGLLPYPRATPGGGGTSIISTLTRAVFGPNLRMGSTRIFGTNSVGGALGRGLSRLSVLGGAAILGYAVGEQIGTIQIC